MQYITTYLHNFAVTVHTLVVSCCGIRFPVSVWHRDLHYGLVAAGGLLAIITFLAQKDKPAPYGKQKSSIEERKWGFPVPILLAHVTSDGIPGVLGFLAVYLRGYHSEKWINYSLAALFVLHYIHRGFVHPFIMKYGQKTVPVGIFLGALGPNLLYHLLVADWLGNAIYPGDFFRRPAVLIGIGLYATGFVINRVADWKLAGMKKQLKKRDDYVMPSGWLFDYIANPNYFGELIQWIGFVLACQAPASLVWLCFTAATFFTRSKFNLIWYRYRFPIYPKNIRALVPFIY